MFLRQLCPNLIYGSNPALRNLSHDFVNFYRRWNDTRARPPTLAHLLIDFYDFGQVFAICQLFPPAFA
jgi:hypothetical protein